MRLLYFITLFYRAYSDCRNIANIAPVESEHVVNVLFQIAAENQFDGIENGRLLVTPNIDLAAALYHTQINTGYLTNGNYKHWVKTWVSLTKRDLSLTQIENLFNAITPECSFENLKQYFNVDTDNCLGYRDTAPPCDLAGNEGCTNLYDIDVTYTMCFMRNNQTNNCVPFDTMPDFWDRNTQTTIWTDEYICVRNADNSKEVELEYFEPSVYIMQKNSTLEYGSFVSIPPIETREFVATFCSDSLNEEERAALVEATQSALSGILNIDPGNLIPEYDNSTDGQICGTSVETRRRLVAEPDWDNMQTCDTRLGNDPECESDVFEMCSNDINCVVQTCNCTCTVTGNQCGDTGDCLGQCNSTGFRITHGGTLTPTNAPVTSPVPTESPTPQPQTKVSVRVGVRITDVVVANNEALDILAGVGRLNETEFQQAVEDNGGKISSIEDAFLVPREEADHDMVENAPGFDLSYWEMVAFIYGLYYFGFLSLEALLVFARDYKQLQSLTIYSSRRCYLEKLRLQQERYRSPDNELGIFKNLCWVHH